MFTWSFTADESNICSGAQAASSLAAMLTPEPYILSPSIITSSIWIPTRQTNCDSLSVFLFLSLIAFWKFVAALTHETGLGKSAITESPAV